MYEKQEDFYYILYNILILMQEMKCNNSSSKCIDFTKLAYLYPFVANKNLAKILKKINDFDNTYLETEELELLSRTFYESRLKMHGFGNQKMTFLVFNFVCIANSPVFR
ncbi:hypothetical protein MKX47_20445 [Solibacillus sp. FSL R7-0668]|uniref:hypothetical protein n=1 Tax=Solibacillus sp. FSL R7-0668 TaxID=2921688 RepID=UPI0030F724C2